jgi:hypothetical protein
LFLSCLILLSLPGPCFAANDTTNDVTDDFRFAASLTAEDEQDYTAVRLTSEVIGRSKSDLSDLLLVSNGRAVPYFLNSYSVTESVSVVAYEMDLADSFIKDSFQYFDYKLSREPSNDIAATSVNIETSGQFVKDIALYGSYDGVNWDFVGSDLIFQVADSQKLFVSLFPEEKYTWYRFRVSGNQEPVSFDRVWLEHSLDIISKNSFIETLTPAISVRQDGKTTVVVLDGLRNLALSEIKIKTDSMFKRNVHVNGYTHTLYNLVFGSENYRDLTLPMNGYLCLSNHIEILIDNGDDAPIEIDSVSVSYLTYDAVFQNTSFPVTLYFGNDAISESPRYDIVNYKEHILSEGYGKSNIGDISERSIKSPETSNAPDYTVLFNITIVVAAILLAALLITRLKRVK